MGLIFVSAFQLICVSLSKAGAKLLLYNICSKLYRLFFSWKTHLFSKSLILNHAVMPGFGRSLPTDRNLLYLIINNKYYFLFRAKRRRVFEDSSRKTWIHHVNAFEIIPSQLIRATNGIVWMTIEKKIKWKSWNFTLHSLQPSAKLWRLKAVKGEIPTF